MNFVKKLCGAAALLLAFSANATTIGFDGVNSSSWAYGESFYYVGAVDGGHVEVHGGRLNLHDGGGNSSNQAWVFGVAAGYSPFDFTSLDIVDYSYAPVNALQFTVSSNLGHTATFWNTEDSWGTYNLDWLGVSSITFDILGTDSSGCCIDGFALDNLVVNESALVSEPTSMALLGLGLVGLSFTRRRKA